MLPALAALPPAPEGRRVLVVANAADAASVDLARYYARKRAVPKGNLLLLRTANAEEISQARFEAEIAPPVRAALARVRGPIDFLLLIRGVPIRVREGGYSVDSLLMSEAVPISKLRVGNRLFDIANNPYFERDEPFTHAKFGIYLACRLDGYTAPDAHALVDRSLAARPSRGPFLLDEAANRNGGGYEGLQATLPRAADRLSVRGFRPVLDAGRAFAGSREPLAGYASWGSNDGAFRPEVYRSLRFLPGAIAETFVSTSGRTFRPTTGGQSLVADLIAGGVTGVKGYVSEPYTVALAHADILFERYTAGRNLAESFYAASPATHWKDVVIGDPLCAPYAR